MDKGDKTELQTGLEGVAIAGDSIVYAAMVYGWLTESNIIAQIGARVASATKGKE